MEDMIRRIVEMDKKAREITDAAQREKLDSEKEIAERAARLREDYLTRARRRIQINRETEQVIAEQEWKKAKSRYDEMERRMNEQFAQQGDDWVEQIVRRVTTL